MDTIYGYSVETKTVLISLKKIGRILELQQFVCSFLPAEEGYIFLRPTKIGFDNRLRKNPVSPVSN